ncbi:MAG: helicase-exonuclease AddAB subunit AddA [Lachnospiraceae bacterium]|nr:helicase-exonuclease AddAB subunit AddA [Lachnospiraceae bacterium]
MAAMHFTPEQQRVIDTREKNILVSAAAGSGKTAVLVERIVQLITDREHPVDIDRLLIVTFTSAAAAEMRERISLAIEARLYEEPENGHLQKQAALIHNAQITTIDSFCLFVIRNNFNDIGLDPAFRVGDEGEIRLMKQDVMAELLEERFAAKEPAFDALVESMGKSGSDKALAEQVMKLYEFSMSLPWPEEWLRERRQDNRIESLEELTNSELMAGVWQEIELRLNDAQDVLKEGIRICEQPDGPYMYAEMLEQDMELLEGLRRAQEQGMQPFYERLLGIKFTMLSRKKDETVDAGKREQVKALRQTVKDMVQDVRTIWFFKQPERMLADMQHSAERMDTLIDVTLEFLERFAQKKREKNIIDFADMEHFALQILVQKTAGGYEPTEAAAEYRRYFAEILIDEYQDSNLVQEALLGSISGEAEGRFNRFMVGDVKQSIYKFRLARPELFMEKYESYAGNGLPACVRIDLKKNFRSRHQVLDSANFVFERIMRKELGGVAYDEAAALYPGAAYPEPEEEDIYRTELLLFDRASVQEGQEAAKGMDAKEQEALLIAQRIRQLVGHFPVTDQTTGALRPASYRDMVILLRTNSGWDDVFVRVLTEAGIPAYAASKTGYFAAQEVQTLLGLLRVIDNPRQDIPLFGVLKSMFGGFTEEELAYVRAVCTVPGTDSEERKKETEEADGRQQKKSLPPDGTLYDRLQRFKTSVEQNGMTGEDCKQCKTICEKWERFEHLLSRYRAMTVYTPVGKLIRTILADTGYLYAVAAMPGGEQRRANVEMLLARAADFEKTSYYGLFHFLRYMEQMERYQIDYGEASILDENADTVRIMSIHKSKGLEFPICFVAGLSKRFNMMDARETVLLDVNLGIGAEYVDLEHRVRQNTLRKNVMAARLKKENLGEELRVLYVAMTRAREKMILTGVIEDAQKLQGGHRLSYSELLSAGCYLALLLPCIREQQSCGGDTEAHVIDMTIVSEGELAMSETKHRIQRAVSEKRLSFEKLLRSGSKGTGCVEALEKQLRFVYPHENLKELYTKTTVSELKKAGHEDFYAGAEEWYPEPEVVPYLPRFARTEEAVSGTDRGSAYHRVMELLNLQPFTGLPEELWCGQIEEQMGQMQEEGRLTAAYRESVRTASVAMFLKTALAHRMQKAEQQGKIYRERPFVLGIPAKRLKAQFPEEETVLVQGIIDVYFEEDGELVLVDYKTDRVEKGQELVDRYRVQLQYYEEALQRLTGLRVKEKLIYSFALQEEISVL